MTNDIKKMMEQESTRVKSLSFHPNKPVVISGHHSGSIKAWDYQMSACIHEFFDHDGSVRAVLFHPRGDFFISGGDDKIIRIWNYTERRITNRLKGHDDFIRSLDFHPTKPWILSASDDQTIMIWNMMSGKLLATARGHCHYVMSARFLGEDLIVSGSLDQSLRIWDCKGLSEGGKKSSLLPDIVIKQIVDGHDRGINAIGVGEDMFVSGGDDRDIKSWEWSDTSVWEKEAMYNHQGPITGLLCSGKYVLSSGEDGLFSLFDMEKRKSIEYRVEGRYWCVASKGHVYAAGHDSGFQVYLRIEPKAVCINDSGFVYLKDFKVYSSNFNTEKMICKTKKDVVSICTENEYLLIQYQSRFEIIKDDKVVLSESGEGILFDIGNGTELIINHDECVYRMSFSGKEKEILLMNEGKLFKGLNDVFFMIKDRNVMMYVIGGEKKSITIPFRPCKIVCCDNRIAIIGWNDIIIYDQKLNLINSVNEMVCIVDGFFHEDVLVYSTHKHLKYIFESKGVLMSVDKLIIPFVIKESMVYFLSDEGVECIEIDISEIKFKKAVINDEDVTLLIEEGRLPGLAPLSYLVKQKKGAVALPYIKDNRQRFELCLSDSRLDECFEYCITENDMEMNKRLAEAAMKECRVDIAEACLLNLKDWNMLLMLYVCSKDDKKIRDLIDKVDDVTRGMIMMYLENYEYFHSIGVIGKMNEMERVDERKEDHEESSDGIDLDTNTSTLDHDMKSEDDICLESLNLKDSEEGYPIHDEILDEYGYVGNDDVSSIMKEGLSLTTEGKFSKAIEMFRNGMISIALRIKDTGDYDAAVDDRRMIGAYISGLTVEKIRRKTESPLKNIMMVRYFSSLPLEKEHCNLASSTAIMVFRKYGNMKEAKELSISLKNEGLNTKAIQKAIDETDPTDEYESSEGIFCHDTLDFRTSGKTCLLCFVKSSKGNVCTSCRIGVLHE